MSLLKAIISLSSEAIFIVAVLKLGFKPDPHISRYLFVKTDRVTKFGKPLLRHLKQLEANWGPSSYRNSKCFLKVSNGEI